MARPTRQPPQRKHHGHHVHGNTQGAIDDAAVEVHVGIQLALHEIIVFQRVFLDFLGQVQQRILDPQQLEHFVREDLEDACPRVEIFIDAVAKAHQADVRGFVLYLGDEVADLHILGVDLVQHLQHGFICAAVQRSPKCSNAG